MCKILKKWLVKKLIAALILGTASVSLITSGLTAQAFTITNLIQPTQATQATQATPTPSTTPPTSTITISNAKATPDSFNPSLSQNTTISYCLNASATVNVGIYQASGTNSKKVAVLTPAQSQNATCYSVNWNGKHDANTEIGTKGELAANGQYFYYIEAKTASATATATDWVTIGESSSNGTLKFIDVQVDNPIFDPWDSQKAAIDFSIGKGGYVTLQINDEDNLKVLKPTDSKWYEKGEYTAYWNGEDELGEIAPQGEYSYSIKIVNGEEVTKKTGKLVVKKGYNGQTTHTEDPRIENVYATKEEFDPGRKEKEYIVFDLTAKADLQVSIYDKDDNLIKKLYNKPDQAAGTYMLQWDGAEALTQDAIFTYRIYAKNARGEDTQKGKIHVAQDRSDSSRANIFKDYVDSIKFNPNEAALGIIFTLEKDADVTVEIRDGKHLIATIVPSTPFAEGTESVSWDGLDKYGNMADEGQYLYRITAKNNAGKEVEEGSFTVKKSDSIKTSDDGDCSQFKDVDKFNQYCKAIQWAVAENIFQGYNNGTFMPDQTIKRAEALKVILKALKIQLIAADSQSLGFYDTDVRQWYATYVKTGVSLGIVHGYGDGTFRPDQLVTHSEAQIMLFRTANSKGQYYPEVNDYYPNARMTRGEMADLLYSQYKNSYELN